MRRLVVIALWLSACGARSDLVDGRSGESQPGTGGAGAAYGGGSAGGAGGAPVECIPSEEVCNGLDDDCDGAVDQGFTLGRKSGPHVIWEGPVVEPVQGDIEPTREGFLMAFSRDLQLANGHDNVWVLLLDGQGALIEIASLPDAKASLGPRLTPGPSGFMASYCKRMAMTDRAGLALVDGAGSWDGLGAVPPGESECFVGAPDAVWTGERFLYTFVDTAFEQVILGRADANGDWVSDEALASNAYFNWLPRFASAGGMTLAAFGYNESGQPTLGLVVLDALGDPVTSLLGATGEPGYLVEAVPGANNGFQLFFLEPGGGVNRMEAFPMGATGFTEVTPIPELAGATSLRVVADPAGGALLAGTKAGAEPRGFAARVGNDGSVAAYWETSQDPEVADRSFDGSMLAVRGDSIVVGYTQNAGSPSSTVETIELGCVAE